MVKSPAHFEQPNTSKGRAATQERDLKPGKSDLKTPRDMDWHRQGKESGLGFSGNAIQVNRYADNPAAGEYRNPPEHKYQATAFGGDSGVERVVTQNRLAKQRKGYA
jgi:hypothetical protein